MRVQDADLSMSKRYPVAHSLNAIRRHFAPGIVGLLRNPFYLARCELWRFFERNAPKARGVVLDVGCGSAPYRGMFSHCEGYIGMDIHNPGHSHRAESIDLYYGGGRFPLRDSVVDTIVTSQVLEHVFEPDLFIGEVSRVLRPGGVLLLTVPFVWDEHERPFDYARYTSIGLQHLLTKHGLRVEDQEKTLADSRIFCQLFLAYAHGAFDFLPSIAHKLVLTAASAILNTAGVTVARLLPRNPNLYLDNLIVARRV